MFIDSVVWIGAKLKRDQWHEKAQLILDKFQNNDIRSAYVTDQIIVETVNFLLRKSDYATAFETLILFHVHDRITIINIDDRLFLRSFDLFRKYPGLSLTDTGIIASMERENISTVYSFDSGFDRVDWINRLES